MFFEVPASAAEAEQWELGARRCVVTSFLQFLWRTMKAAKRHAGGKWSVMSSAEVRADSSLFFALSPGPPAHAACARRSAS